VDTETTRFVVDDGGDIITRSYVGANAVGPSRRPAAGRPAGISRASCRSRAGLRVALVCRVWHTVTVGIGRGRRPTIAGGELARRRCGVDVTRGVLGPHLKRVRNTNREVRVGRRRCAGSACRVLVYQFTLEREPVSEEWNVNVAVVPVRVPLGPLSMNVSGGVVSAASARSSVVATNANRASNGTSRIKRLLNTKPPLVYGIIYYALFSERLSRKPIPLTL
jgi:hypothetical protein